MEEVILLYRIKVGLMNQGPTYKRLPRRRATRNDKYEFDESSPYNKGGFDKSNPYGI